MATIDHGNFDIVLRLALDTLHERLRAAVSARRKVSAPLASALFRGEPRLDLAATVKLLPLKLEDDGTLVATLQLEGMEVSSPIISLLQRALPQPPLPRGEVSISAKAIPVVEGGKLFVSFSLAQNGLLDVFAPFEQLLLSALSIVHRDEQEARRAAQTMTTALHRAIHDLATRVGAELFEDRVPLADIPEGAPMILAREGVLALLWTLPKPYAGPAASAAIVKRLAIPRGELAVCVINNAYVLGGPLRSTLSRLLKLDESGFQPDHPFFWRGDSEVVHSNGFDVRLVAVRAGIDRGGQLVVLLSIIGRHALPVQLHATLTAATNIRVSDRALTFDWPDELVHQIELKVDEGARVAAGLASLGASEAAYAIAHAFVRDNAARMLNQAIRSRITDRLPAIELPRPAHGGPRLTLTSTQADAPMRSPDDFPVNDLVVHVTAPAR